MDWTNKIEVIKYAQRLGSGVVVYKHPSRNNFNITHSSRTDRFKKEWVVFSS